MIKRIVKLTFQEDQIDQFLAVFDLSKTSIRGFKGCHHLELVQGKNQTNLFFTLSVWENEAALDAYRQSELFQNVWHQTKALFKERAEAWTVDVRDKVML